MDFKDYYATLGVAKTASEKEIKQAFRKMARKYHPDVNPGDKSAESRFKEINEAYEVVGDPEKRRKYDELGSNWKMYEQAQQQRGGAGGFDPSQWNVHTGSSGAQGNYRTMTPEEMRDLFGNEDPFSDFFHAFFSGGGEPEIRGRGGRAGTRSPRVQQGRDVEHPLDLSLEDAYRGSTRRFTMKHDGQSRTVDVRIPAGVAEGSRVRVAGEGEKGSGGAAAGDLYLRVHVTPDSRFERKGQDLHAKVRVPVTTAVLGGEGEVPNLGGKPLRLKIPAGTQNGQVFRLKGHGMPLVGKPGEHGDLYATVEAELPRQLTPEERTHYEALARLAAGKSSAA
ncbi:MAG TPA: J domain-containing protein [Vicinamibacterales bacterium]|nr:J domain-containing protein [Vicinamibacterales bacterium]